MSKIKILDLANKLGVERKELLAKAQEFGISAKSTTKTLSDAEVLKLENIYKKYYNLNKYILGEWDYGKFKETWFWLYAFTYA